MKIKDEEINFISYKCIHMKKDVLITILFLTACGDAGHKEEPQDVAIEQGSIKDAVPDTFYYLLTGGAKQQDTEAIKFTISGDRVEGKMMHMPYEKDWRFGKLSGVRESDYLSLKWIFIQEGMLDSAQIVFKMEGDNLIQQSYNSEPDTGENIVDTASVKKVYHTIKRSSFPKQDFDMGL